MFTGIIQTIGQIQAIQSQRGDVRLHIAASKLDLSNASIGDSIAVNGVCLTVTELIDAGFVADLSNETLKLTNLGKLQISSRVNLEKALTLQTPLGGHLVSGHVDGLAEVISRDPDGRSVRFSVRAPKELARYIAQKGSITVDGVSLTVNAVDGAVFALNIVPHTLQATILDDYRPGQKVNLEVDLVARYLERLLLGEQAAVSTRPGTIDKGMLNRAGFRGHC